MRLTTEVSWNGQLFREQARPVVPPESELQYLFVFRRLGLCSVLSYRRDKTWPQSRLEALSLFHGNNTTACSDSGPQLDFFATLNAVRRWLCPRTLDGAFSFLFDGVSEVRSLTWRARSK